MAKLLAVVETDKQTIGLAIVDVPVPPQEVVKYMFVGENVAAALREFCTTGKIPERCRGTRADPVMPGRSSMTDDVLSVAKRLVGVEVEQQEAFVQAMRIVEVHLTAGASWKLDDLVTAAIDARDALVKAGMTDRKLAMNLGVHFIHFPLAQEHVSAKSA